LQLFVIPPAQAAVDERDFALGLREVRGQNVLRVEEFRVQSFRRRGGGAFIASGKIFLIIRLRDGKLGAPHAAAGHGKRFQMRLRTSGAGFFQKAVGGVFFRFRATYALIGERLEQRERAMGGCIHKNFPFQTNCCAFIIPKCGSNVNPRPARTKSRFYISRVCKINV